MFNGGHHPIFWWQYLIEKTVQPTTYAVNGKISIKQWKLKEKIMEHLPLLPSPFSRTHGCIDYMCVYAYIYILCLCIYDMCIKGYTNHINHATYPSWPLREFCDTAWFVKYTMCVYIYICIYIYVYIYICVFEVFWNVRRFGNSTFSSVLLCHLAFFVTGCLSAFVSVHDVAILVVHCSWGPCRQVCPQSGFFLCSAKYQCSPFLVLCLFWSLSQHACIHNLIASFFMHPFKPPRTPRCIATLSSTPAWPQDAPNICAKNTSNFYIRWPCTLPQRCARTAFDYPIDSTKGFKKGNSKIIYIIVKSH